MTPRRAKTNILRKAIKKNGQTLAQTIANTLQLNEELTAKEIIDRILVKLVPEQKDMPQVFRRNVITDLSKDFNAKLLTRLSAFNVDRKLNSNGVNVYFLTK